MESGGGGGRGRRSLSDEKLDSGLGGLLRVKEENSDGRNTATGVTLSSILGQEKRPAPTQSNRTLLEIIRDDPSGNGKEGKKTWKSFREKLRLRRAGAAWTSTVPIPASDVNTNRLAMMRRHSTRYAYVPDSEDPTQESSANGGGSRPGMSSLPSNRAMMLRRNSTVTVNRHGGRFDDSTPLNTGENDAAELAEENTAAEVGEEEDEGSEETTESTEGAEPPARMSLMALLAETDRQMGLDGSSYMIDDNDEEEEEGEEEEEEDEDESGGGGGGAGYNNCCVCMVRHKGAAFIPCGHTFCRLCSRELWVQRGNCPLCNGFILEILDIF